MKRIKGIIICIVAAICAIIFASCDACQTVTVSEYEAKCRKKIDSELTSRNHSVRRRIEDAHITVDVKYAEVSFIKCQTYDGSNDAGGKEGRNIKNVRMQITAVWDGVFHRNGQTVFEMILAKTPNGKWQVQNGEIVKTDALVNLEDPNFWFDVGVIIGTLLI